MLDADLDIHSLSSFKRNTNDMIRQMKESGAPMVLTINGKVELVVQDAESYQRLLEMVDRLETIQALKEGLADVEHQRTRPAREALEELRQKYDIPR